MSRRSYSTNPYSATSRRSYSTSRYSSASRRGYSTSAYDTDYMQQDQFLRAQAAQAQAEQAQRQQQNPYMQNPSLQDPYMQNRNMQNPYTQGPAMQNPYSQVPNFQNQQYTQQNPTMQNSYAQYPQDNQYMPNNGGPSTEGVREGDFFHAGDRYNIHDIHRIIDSRPHRRNGPPPPNRGPDAFSRGDSMGYGPHNAPPPRLGPNGRPMVRERFGMRRDWVEIPDEGDSYRESREERERQMAADIEFIERNPHRLGPTWNPSWKRGGWWVWARLRIDQGGEYLPAENWEQVLTRLWMVATSLVGERTFSLMVVYWAPGRIEHVWVRDPSGPQDLESLLSECR